MRLTESSQDVLHSFTDKGLDWSEACLYCADEAHDAMSRGDSEGLRVWRDRAFEIDAWAKSRNKI